MTSNKSRAAFQELTACKGAVKKLHDTRLSTTGVIIEDDAKKSSPKLVKEINHEHTDRKRIRLRDAILSCVIYIGFFYSIKIAKLKNLSHVDTSSSSLNFLQQKGTTLKTSYQFIAIF